MARRLIECVPNFSEGRRKNLIQQLIDVFSRQAGCFVLDSRADEDHNRLVISLAGEPDPIQDALIAASKFAVEEIDLRKHRGGHPRIGAIDVIPFTPLKNMSMEDCVALVHSFGPRFYDETGVPVYYYEEAAASPERKRLEVIRKGQFEKLREEAALPERRPDVGGSQLHESAGATAIGARKFLVAFNVNLGTKDVDIAKRIASAVRASSGGLCHVKGIGLSLEERGLVQVSMNIVDYEKNPLYRVVEMIRMEAARWGVKVVETEVYGMIPAAALIDSTSYYMQMTDFNPAQIIELQLLEMSE